MAEQRHTVTEGARRYIDRRLARLDQSVATAIQHFSADDWDAVLTDLREVERWAALIKGIITDHEEEDGDANG